MIPHDIPRPCVEDAERRLVDPRDDLGERLRRIVDPPAYCPGCLAEAGQRWPQGASSQHCSRCLDRIRRVYQCARWNRDHAHQVAAGHASWDAFSARWRASSGLAPLSAEATRRYVTLEMIRGPMGALLPHWLRTAIHQAWCAGHLLGVAAWLCDDPPADPEGLWAAAAGDAPDVLGKAWEGNGDG